MKSSIKKIILIDDDPILNHLNKVVINRFLRPGIIQMISFTNPHEGLDYIREDKAGENALLLLDINMPAMSGWEFLKRMQAIEASILDNITIYILSSSIDPSDKKKAADNKLVKKYLTKPISDHLKEIFEEPQQ